MREFQITFCTRKLLSQDFSLAIYVRETPGFYVDGVGKIPTQKYGKKESVMRLLSEMKRFAKDQSGATAIEYGLIAAGISVAIIGVLAGTKDKLVGTFTKVQNGLN